MKTEKLKGEHYDLLKSGHPVCPRYGKFSVGKLYKIINPYDKNDFLIARCTQNCPIALILHSES